MRDGHRRMIGSGGGIESRRSRLGVIRGTDQEPIQDLIQDLILRG